MPDWAFKWGMTSRRLGAQHPVTGMRYAAVELTPWAKQGRRGAQPVTWAENKGVLPSAT
jgi:hypothetical protein